MQHENRSRPSFGSRPSPKFQSRPTYSHSEELHKYNPATDDIRDITCWRCGDKNHASFMYNLLPSQPESPIAPPRNIPQSSQDSNNQSNNPFSNSGNIISSSNFPTRDATSPNFTESRGSSNCTSTTRPVVTRANESYTINCIKTNSNKPAIINKNAAIQAVCDPCAKIIFIQ
ncbi:hypothetical protein AVEN_126399-1 [Araneus ventricosus]|uniref:Uncharacterized protein n=1 Tax=Araneus ventricosus TaxID=182803 RepID=A0A4Y2GG09_ARAVE|nr:hypothetical protein AVEN_126399-1 [Araneus ventricosus]